MLKKFKRSVSLTGVIIISISGMLGSGIFVLPGIVYQVTGPSIPLAYFIAALGVLPTVFSKAELSTAMPASGGTYIYVERTLGPMLGTITGLGLWFSLLLKCSFALTGFGAYLSLFTDIDISYAAFSLLVLITTLNILGVGKVASTLFVVVLISILTLTGVSLVSLPSLSLHAYTPFLGGGLDGLFSASATVFISYAGVTKIAAIAGEVKDPERGLPRGMLYSLFITTFIYCMATTTLVGILGEEKLSGNLRPFFTLGEILGGQTASFALSLVAILTMTSMANAGLLAASRFPYAMARDKLLPSFLGRISKKFVTPTMSILASMVVVAIAISLGNIENVAKVASAFMIFMFIMVNVSVIVLRETQVQWYKPRYKSPLYPLTQIFGILCCGLLLWKMGSIAFKAIVFVIIFGPLLYVFYSRKKTTRKGVLGMRGKRHDLVSSDKLPSHCPSFNSHLETFEVTAKANVIVALFGKERSAEMLIEMGVALCDHGNLEITHIIEIPEQTNLEDVSVESRAIRSLRRRITAMAIEKKCPITFDPVATHDMIRTIYDMGLRHHCRWLMVEWIGKRRGSFTFHDPIGWSKKHLKCHLAVFRDAGIRYVRKIMVLIEGCGNDSLVAKTAGHLAKVFDAEVTFVRYSPLGPSDEGKLKEESYLKEFAKHCFGHCHFLVISSPLEISSIVAQTVEFDLLVFGGQEHRFVNNFIPSRDDKIMGDAACSVMSIQGGG